MESKNVSVRLNNTISLGLFFQDLLIMTMVLSIFRTESMTLSISYVFLIAAICITILCGILFQFIEYNKIANRIASLVICAILLLFGTSIWMYMLLAGFVIWRMEERFAKRQEEPSFEGYFVLVFILLFTLLWLLSRTLLSYLNEGEMISIVIFGMIFHIGNRLVSSSIQQPKAVRPPIWKISFFLTALMSIAVGLAAIIYYVGELVRTNVITKTEGALQTVFTPIGYLFNQVTSFSSLFLLEKEPTETKIQIGETPEPESKMIEEVTINTQWTIWLAVIVGSLIVATLIWFLLKSKREKDHKQEMIEHTIETNRMSLPELETKKESEEWHYNMDIHIVRDAYREFEKNARHYGFERRANETVREWFKRAKFSATERFFEVYDQVRYGESSIARSDGDYFINELGKISEEFSEQDV